MARHYGFKKTDKSRYNQPRQILPPHLALRYCVTSANNRQSSVKNEHQVYYDSGIFAEYYE